MSQTELEQYLDHAIRNWRKAFKEAIEDQDYQYAHTCRCYIDAFQSVRVSTIGSLLPQEDN